MKDLKILVGSRAGLNLVIKLILLKGKADIHGAEIRLILNDPSGTIALSILLLIQERHVIEKSILGCILFLL